MTSDRGRKLLRVEVVYALREKQVLVELEVEEGTTVREAVERSGLLTQFQDIELRNGRVGIFGRAVRLDARPGNGDRVEIYRPLIADPMQARRERARRSPLRARKARR